MSAETNVVVFKLQIDGRDETRVADAPARADDSIRLAWESLRAKEPLRPEDVTHIYSEWEPSALDKQFLDGAFPEQCRLYFSFARPSTEDGWAEAIRLAEEQQARDAAERAAREAFAAPADKTDDLMPVLRDLDGFAELVVNVPVGPGVGFFLAHVAWTPRRTIGTNYVMTKRLEEQGGDPGELLGVACGNFVAGLEVTGQETEAGERVFFTRHPLDIGASALCLPDLYENASGWAGAGELFVGFPDPSALFITALKNERAVAGLREMILGSDYMGAVALTPACFRLDASGLTLIARRARDRVTPSPG